MSDKKRKSFVLHIDVLQVLDDLDNEQAGLLFKAIYANRIGEDITMDAITKIALSPFKAQFARDDEKYQNIVQRNKNNGSKGGRPQTKGNPDKPSGLSGNPSKPKKADSDSDSDSVKDSDSDKEDKKPITSAKLPKFSQDDLDCAKWIYELLLKLNPSHKKPNFESWANEVRKIVNIDNRTYQEISDLMLWVNQDVFWQSNILSPKKLREKWDQLILAKNRNSGGSSVTMTNMATVEHFKKLAEIEDGNDYAQLRQN